MTEILTENRTFCRNLRRNLMFSQKFYDHFCHSNICAELCKHQTKLPTSSRGASGLIPCV